MDQSLNGWLADDAPLRIIPLRPSPYDHSMPAPWQLIEMAAARRLSEMRAAESRKRIERSIAQLEAIKAPRFQTVGR